MGSDASHGLPTIRLGGVPRVEVAGRQIFFPTKRAASVFALLSLHSGSRVTRERLIAAVWPDFDAARARRNLNTTLWRIRRTIDSCSNIRLSATREAVELSLDGAVVDVILAKELLKRARSAGPEEQRSLLESVCSLLKTEFLEGLDDEWCDDERRELHRLRLEAIRSLSIACERTGDLARRVTLLEELVALDPLDEEGHRDLMRAYYVLGNRGMALNQYRLLRESLGRELGVEPSNVTRQLWEEIRASPMQRTQPLPVADGHRMGIVSDVPLVGRRDVLQRAVAALQAAQDGSGSCLLITGGMGIGKTRVVEALAAESRIRNMCLLTGACSESSPPYQGIVQALWPRIAGLPVVAEPLRTTIDRLFQYLMPAVPGRPRASSGFEPTSSALVLECLANLVLSAAASAPTVMILENVHYVDRATEALLSLLADRLATHRLVIVLTLRSEEPEASRLIHSFGRSGAEEIELGPLTPEEVRLLARRALRTPLISDELVRFLVDRSSGVPLFILELLKFLTSESCLSRDSRGKVVVDEACARSRVPRVSTGVAEVVRKRIMRLDGQARNLLAAAAVLGIEVEFDLLERLAGMAEDQFVGSVERLVEACLVRETRRGLRFDHEVTRGAALSLVSTARSRRLHANAALLLEELSPTRVEDIALHWEQAGEFRKALEFFESSGDKARRVYANENACLWYTRGIEAVREIGRGDSSDTLLSARVRLLQKRQEVLDLLGRRSEQVQDVEALLAIAARSGDKRMMAEGALLKSEVLCRLNDSNGAVESGLLAASLFREICNVSGEARAHELVGVAFMTSRDLYSARVAFKRSLSLHLRAADRAGAARCNVGLGTLASFDGRIRLGLQYLERAQHVLEELGDRRSLAAAVLQQGVLYRCLGLNQRSKDHLERGIRTLEEIGDRIGQARGRSQLAFTHIALGELRDALRESLASLKSAREAGDVRAQIVFLNNIAYGTYRVLGDFRRAVRSVSQAIQLATQGHSRENVATYYGTMAAILLDRGAYAEALRWAKQAEALYRAWDQPSDYVGQDISFRLGVAHMKLGEFELARGYLTKVLRYWKSGGDLSLLPHALGALGLVSVAEGKRSSAIDYARQINRMLRRTDGLEQVQTVYWMQGTIFRRLGMDAAARRSFRRASKSLLEQASRLGFHLRAQFLATPTNREILADAEGMRLVPPGARDISGRRSVRCNDAVSLSNGRSAVEARITPLERRRVLMMLIVKGVVGQRDLADRLGVSTRTVRSDLRILRSQGFHSNLVPPDRV
jgi:DNA-binding SARP family transcriptional activator